jgi:hypothetical protein
MRIPTKPVSQAVVLRRGMYTFNESKIKKYSFDTLVLCTAILQSPDDENRSKNFLKFATNRDLRGKKLQKNAAHNPAK